MDISWHKNFAKSWRDRVLHQRLPHAVLLLGPVGTGKRAAAQWLACLSLGIEPAFDLPQYPGRRPEHADLRWLSPPEDKDAIVIDQIRALVADLTLTSYEGGGKVAVVEPANSMTANAANSLLKTLEEPPGDALLILIADRKGRLPATIFSRCQRIDFAPPATDVSLAWLDRHRPGAAWAEALRVAGGAPLAAIAALDSLETGAKMARELNAVGQGKDSPIAVAARWAKLDGAFVLNWLSRQVQQAIVAVNAGPARADGLLIDDFVLHRMDRPNLFCYLDIINRLRGQPGGSFNLQLTLEGLLIDWAGGLAECGQQATIDGMELMLARR